MAAPKSKPKPKSAKAPTSRLVTSRFKFNKLGVMALAAVLSIAGVVYVFTSHASSRSCLIGDGNGIHQCDYGDTSHSEGYAQTIKLYYPSIGFVSRAVWKDPSPGGRYMWFGPYANVSSNVNNIRACWYFATDDRPGTTIVTFDVTANSNHAVQTTSGALSIPNRPYVVRGGVNYLPLRLVCTGTPNFPDVSSGIYSQFEVRARVLKGDLFVYKTTWQTSIGF